MFSNKHIEIVKNVKSSELCKMEIMVDFFPRRETQVYPAVKMSAKRQREIFGFALFGKKTIQFNGRGITTRIKVSFGSDYDIQDYKWKEIVAAVENKKKVK